MHASRVCDLFSLRICSFQQCACIYLQSPRLPFCRKYCVQGYHSDWFQCHQIWRRHKRLPVCASRRFHLRTGCFRHVDLRHVADALTDSDDDSPHVEVGREQHSAGGQGHRRRRPQRPTCPQHARPSPPQFTPGHQPISPPTECPTH